MALGHLNEKILDEVKKRLWIVSRSLHGLGGLFTQIARAPCLDGDEFSGIGRLLKGLAEELYILEDILNCGYDSTADARNTRYKEEDDDDQEDSDNDKDEESDSEEM